jgi:RNA polymerase sigma-70 factor (ECF subfamily)
MESNGGSILRTDERHARPDAALAPLRSGRRSRSAKCLQTQDLVAAARRGDRNAMQELYVRHAGSIQNYVARIVGDRHDAEDVTQQVFAKLLTSLDRYRPTEAAFTSWVLAVAHNVAIDHLRRRNALPCEDVEPHTGVADDSANDRRSVLREALATLPDDQRDVVLLRHLVGLSPEEVAAHLGRSVRAVHGLSYRGTAAARQALNELGSAPATLAMTSRCNVAVGVSR